MDLVSKMLREKCFDWPDCVCGTKWQYWQERTEAWEVEQPSDDEIQWARLDIFLLLNCAAMHSPDRRVRRHATIQTLHPVWRRRRNERH
jgi:hypothetical protein